MIVIIKRMTCDDCGKVAEVEAEKAPPPTWHSVYVSVAPCADMRADQAKLVCSLRCAGALVLKEGDKLARKADAT